jgi:hypothetical protein
MDTSELYIDMCLKAVEIQKLDPGSKIYDEDEDREHELTSFYYLPHAHKVSVLKWDNDEGHYISGGYRDNQSDAVWLPRQDQLQEMMGIIPFDLEGQFHYWFTEEGCKVKWSWEQHWLAFVMKEKFNKQWNGENWVEVG